MRSYIQEFFKNQYTSYLNKIEQNYKKNLSFPIFLNNVRPTVLILIFTTFVPSLGPSRIHRKISIDIFII